MREAVEDVGHGGGGGEMLDAVGDEDGTSDARWELCLNGW